MGFTPLDNIIFNVTNKKTTQSLSDFQVGISAATLATLEAEQLGTLSSIFGSMKSIACNRFMLNMVKGHHIHLRCHPPFSFILNGLTLKLLKLTVLVSGKRLMSS